MTRACPSLHRSVSTVSYMENVNEEDLMSKGQVKYENTYQLEPSERFPVKPMQMMLEEVLAEFLEEQTYEKDNCPKLTKSISDVSCCCCCLLSI